jgi:hypothetical protein
MKKILKFAFLCIAIVLLASCESSNEENVTTGNLTLDLSGLEELGANFVYEGWLIVDGNPISTGTFTSVSFPQSFTI